MSQGCFNFLLCFFFSLNGAAIGYSFPQGSHAHLIYRPCHIQVSLFFLLVCFPLNTDGLSLCRFRLQGSGNSCASGQGCHCCRCYHRTCQHPSGSSILVLQIFLLSPHASNVGPKGFITLG